VNGPGRLRRQVRRALVAAGGREVTTSELVRWCYRPGVIVHNHQRRLIRAAASEVCERVRLDRRGRSFVIVWRPLQPIEPAKPRHRPTGRLWHGWPETEGMSATDD
jgi:hypothetical protein